MDANPTCKVAFHEMGIDDRILEGVAQLRWQNPTRIQEKAIPFMLEGKSVVAQARTGSGKTGAFLVPCLHRVLTAKATEPEQAVRVLVLAPSKELCRQISEMADKLSIACSRELRVLDLSPHLPLEYQRPLLAELPDVVVGPPGRVLSHVLAGNLSLQTVQSVVVDEADLMLAYQHSDALTQIWGELPSYYQSFITSATLGKDMKHIKTLLMKSDSSHEQALRTVILRLKEPPLPANTHLTQYYVKLEEFDKAVSLYSMYRLNMINGKTIIFVNSVNKGYRLRMFLGQFGIPSCILNSELPASCRCDIIEQFNAGKYDTIIATDDTGVQTNKHDQMKDVDVDPESGTSRGLDFQFVSNIINFDFPTSVTSYIHRVGRTARGNNQGTALSMVCIKEQEHYEQVSKKLSKMMQMKQGKNNADSEGVFNKFSFDIAQLDGFSYRANDVWLACTNHKVFKTRRREIAQQLLNSKKLEAFFHDNPNDKALLRHDKTAHGITTQHHLRNIPEYNVPSKLRDAKTHDMKKTGSLKNRIKNVKRLQRSSNNKSDKRTPKSKTNPSKKGFKKGKPALTKTQKKNVAKKSNPLTGL